MQNIKNAILVAVFAVIGIVGGLLFVGNETTFLNSSPEAQPNESIVENQSQTQQQAIIPAVVSIPKLNVYAAVEHVGQDTLGRMDIPKVAANVAWYQLGFRPGEKGSAVLAGHFDDVTGAPAVFFYLSSLVAGDQVIVEDQEGNRRVFVVVNKTIYAFDQVPLEQVFASTDKPRLNLITCDGVFNQNTRNYSQRLVVYTELES
ncbi:class F sortase [Candidatus Daviesbacteria bacterium]|nr:class F sortase [Candidatus Daviesbacteria bacterium]